MRDVEITLREILISIVIVLVMIGLGFFIAESIRDNVSNDNEKYFKSLKVDNQPDIFDYAIRTEVGNMLSYGKFKANDPVSDQLINDEYFSLIKIEEHYTMHTRVVSYKCGKSTCHRTETYWTWDEVDREQFNTKSFNFLGRDFKYNVIDFNNYSYKDTVGTSPTVRFQFYIIPKEFSGTLYSKASNKTINSNVLYAGKHIKDLINEKEHSADNWVIGFWIMWSFLVAAVVIAFMVLENRYINNKW